MDTVLGLSLTSSSIGWILLDRPGVDANILDHDVFDVGAGVANDGDITKHLAAVRGAQSIAAISGHRMASIGVTWSNDAYAKATLLLKALSEMQFDDVSRVTLPDAVREWARTLGPAFGIDKCAVCVVESAAVTVLSFGYDNVRTFTNNMRESADGISRWLAEIFESNRLEPERLYLTGSRGDLELITGSLHTTLSMPVDASSDAQLALARGAALALSPSSVPVTPRPAGTGPTPRWRRLRQHVPDVAEADATKIWTEVLKKPPRKAVASHRPIQGPRVLRTQHPTPPDAAAVDVTADAVDATPPRRPAWMRDTPAEPEVVDAEIVDTTATSDDAAAIATPTRRRPAWMRDAPPAAAAPDADAIEHTADGEDAKPPVATVKSDSADKTTRVITLPVDEKPADSTRRPQRPWFGPHARAAAVVFAGLVAVFSLGPLIFGQKDNSAEDRPAPESATTSSSVHVVPSPATPPAVLHQVAAEPAPAPVPPPVVAPPVVAAAEGAAPVEEPEPNWQAPVTAEPMVVQQTPAASAPVAQPAAAAQSPAPAAPPPAPIPAAAPIEPAPAAPGPALEVAPPSEPAPPPQDPVMQVLSPLFGALP